MTETVAAVVITYNRKQLLTECLDALLAQTRPLDTIILIDNASTDGTQELLQEHGYLQNPTIDYVRLPENTGGAGGFYEGVKRGHEAGYDWLWLMDDDAIASRQALEKLFEADLNEENLYGSVAQRQGELSWPMTSFNRKPAESYFHSTDLPKLLDVTLIPFLGIFISKKTIDHIGYPDPKFFLAADDVEYCFRARKKGMKIILVRDSIIEHPLSERSAIWLPWRKFYSLKLSPWKRYYDVRNRIFVAKRHYGLALYYSTIPGSFLRLFVTLLHEKQRLMQIKAFACGMLDGLTGRGGKRHHLWGL
jgi:GT2 family glycosyltransferase